MAADDQGSAMKAILGAVLYKILLKSISTTSTSIYSPVKVFKIGY